MINKFIDQYLYFLTPYHLTIIGVVAFVILLLIITLICRKKNDSLSAQTLTHILVFIFEIITITTIINLLISGSSNETDSFLNILRNHIFAYTLYQLLLFVFFKLKDSLYQDGLAAVKNVSDKIQIHAEFEEQVPLELIDKFREYYDKNNVTLPKKHKQIINVILDNAILYNNKEINTQNLRFNLKLISQEMEHESKIFSFSWMNSILLRIAK
ncbi:hypothetical protein [Cytobacillus horneckiae]|uniref:Uncharacterized protein n=1 Tax=Cytobacillus horneckiae TaxID=549687 RepID=A0A2N0ZFD0_9BACI|nr:hypothetical protein [Cytobacillus horneckiae]MEC1155656.1 hypothetical protein [Cytobacillus horneckiae]MED2936974.1 hypothetical protein [Cytobacillus horneckiae]PKG28207.1 hypothetical protein CWS20_15300 [Cytobacillus horneckiae]